MAVARCSGLSSLLNTTKTFLNPYIYGMNERFKIWLKRVGWIGFFFFLIKGLLWLLIPYLIAKGFLSI